MVAHHFLASQALLRRVLEGERFACHWHRDCLRVTRELLIVHMLLHRQMGVIISCRLGRTHLVHENIIRLRHLPIYIHGLLRKNAGLPVVTERHRIKPLGVMAQGQDRTLRRVHEDAALQLFLVQLEVDRRFF